MSYNARTIRLGQVNLWKWELLSLGASYEAVLYADLDVDLLPLDAAADAQLIALEWAARLPALLSRTARATPPRHHVGYADSTTPLNGGMFWVLPPNDGHRLYTEGLAVLRAPWNFSHGWNRSGTPATLFAARGNAYLHPHLFKRGWQDIDYGDLDQVGTSRNPSRAHSPVGVSRSPTLPHLLPPSQGFFLFMLHHVHHAGGYATRSGKHHALHYVKGTQSKPFARTLLLASEPPHKQGCSWDNLKRHAYLAGVDTADEQSTSEATACAARFHAVRAILAARMPNATACCGELGQKAPGGPFGSDYVPVF